MDALTASSFDAVGGDKTTNLLAQNMAPTWGNYLYQNILPNLQNTDWLLGLNNGNGGNSPNLNPATTTNNAAAGNTASANAGTDLFPNWSNTVGQAAQQPLMGQPGPSNYYMNYYGGSIAPSLLAGGGSGTTQGSSAGTPAAPGSTNISPSIDVVDKIVASPSPLGTGSPNFAPQLLQQQQAQLQQQHNHHHAQQQAAAAAAVRGRNHSIDSDADGEVDPEAETRSQHSHHSEHDSVHDHDEGVERDGMIWGMKVEEYRALSARERKRVRNRISARTFRAKRKEHLSSLESTLGAKDLEIKLAHEENSRLRRELADMKRRLAKYEAPTF